MKFAFSFLLVTCLLANVLGQDNVTAPELDDVDEIVDEVNDILDEATVGPSEEVPDEGMIPEPAVVTDAPADATLAPTEVPVAAVVTPAPTEAVVTPAPTEAVVTEVAPEVTTAPSDPAETVVETESTASPTTAPPPAETDSNTCARATNNTDEKCAQLLVNITAECDCYNFCDGKVIGCLEFGDPTSFSCTGEHVEGCTEDQKATAAPTAAETTASGNAIPETDPPMSLETEGFTCSAGGIETNTEQCNQYKETISVKCECSYFCSGGSLVGCQDDGETGTFGCSGADPIFCYENPGTPAPDAVSAGVALQKNNNMWTVAVALLVVAV
ncbi:expressed unknown protein [Seminavis robusta]|uniref:Uncharacterized protein n=1 Tax=Seminavis robusta TaxID=568900 RepID=A0A9N8EQL3_9STRA|nr:expressed unknown protein [Seminavis robusta]|eukprot:Sro1676_g290460.1 n/a (329) ;mRNA; r:6120-7106